MKNFKKVKEDIVEEIKTITKGQDVIVAFSGGMDSTLALYLVKEALGKEKLKAVTIDWGVYSYTKSRENVKKLIKIMDVEHIFIPGEKEIESLHTRGPGCNRCVKKIKIPILRKYAKDKIIIGGANQSDSWGKQHIKILNGIYSPLIELGKKEIKALLDYYNIPVLRIGENSTREGCLLKHLWKPLASPYYHARAVVLSNELLINYIDNIGLRPDIANVKIIGPLSKNIALINIYPLPPYEVRDEIIKGLRTIKEIDEIFFVDRPITLVIRANKSQINNIESIYWIEKGRISSDFGFPIKFKWLVSNNRKLNSFHVVDYERGE